MQKNALVACNAICTAQTEQYSNTMAEWMLIMIFAKAAGFANEFAN
jgi:hypothetical protein